MDKQKINPLTNRVIAERPAFTKPKETVAPSGFLKYMKQKQQTAYQRINAKPDPEPKWYKGDKPTDSEIRGRIFTVSQNDPARGRQLYAQYEEQVKNPSSPIYNPYTATTSRASAELQSLGFDTSDKNFLDNNAWLKQHYRFGTGGSPLAPSSTSTREENAAYWMYKYMDDEATTRQAETEWQAMQEEIAYLVGRTDRNYSDAEILSKIDMSKYKTLAKMDEAREQGLSIGLTRPVGYSKDAMNGVVWGARNGDNGDPSINAVKYVLGQGKSYQKNEAISARLDPSNEAFNPYAVGSTIDDVALYFGESTFDQKWLADNAAMRGSNDETERKNYAKVYAAEETTQKAEAERERLYSFLDEMLKDSSDADSVIADARAYLEGDYWEDEAALSTLMKMDKSLKTGDLIETTRSVDYKWEDVETYIRKRCDEMNAKQEAEDNVARLEEEFFVNKTETAVKNLFGMGAQKYDEPIGHVQKPPSAPKPTPGPTPASTSTPTPTPSPTPTPTPISYESDKAIKQVKNGSVNKAGAIIAKIGTPAEKTVFAMGYDADSDAITGSLIQFVKTCSLLPERANEYMVGKADDYAVQNYPAVQKTIADYQKLNSRLPEIESYEATIAENQRLISETEYQHELAGLYSKYTDEQKEAAYNYISTIGYENDEEENALLSAFKGDEFEARQFMKEVSNAFADGEVDDHTIDSWFDEVVRLSYDDRMELAAEIVKLSSYVSSFRKEQEELQPKYEAALAEKEKIDRYYSIAEKATGITRTGDGYFTDAVDVMDFLYEAGEYAKNAEKYKAYSDAQQLQASGISDASVREYGKEAVDNNNEAIEAIDRAVALSDKYGIVAPELIADAEKEKERLLRSNKEWEYYELQFNEDFNDISEEKANLVAVDIINWHMDIASSSAAYNRFEGMYSAMTEVERKTLAYLYENKGKNAAEEYYDFLWNEDNGMLTTRYFQNEVAKAEEFAHEKPFLASVSSVLQNVAAIGGTFYSVGQLLSGKQINPYHKSFLPGTMAFTERSTVKADFRENVGDNILSDAFDIFYDAGMSAADSLVNGALTSPFLPASGAMDSIVKKVATSFAGATPLGLNAAGQTMREAAMNGADDLQIAALGAASFFAETATEAITISNMSHAKLMGSVDEFKKSLPELLKDVFVEESGGEALSEAISSASDYLIMGELSAYEKSVDYYMQEQQMTRPDAERAAFRDILGNIFTAYITGAVSYGMSGGISYMSGRISKGKNKPADSVENHGEETTAPTEETAPEAAETAVENMPRQGEEGYVDRFDRPAEEAAPRQGEEGYVDRFDRPAEQVETEQGGKGVETPVESVEAENKVPFVDSVMNSIVALYNSVGADEQSQVVAMTAALTPENADAEKARAITAAAQNLGMKFGTENAVFLIADVMESGKASVEAVQTAFVIAANSNGAAAAVMESLEKESRNPSGAITAENVFKFLAAAQEDMNNPSVMAEVGKTIADNAVANKAKGIIANGALKAVDNEKTNVAVTKEKLNEAQKKLDKKTEEHNASVLNLKSAIDQLNQNTTPENSGMVDHAIAEEKGLRETLSDYERGRDNAQMSYANAKKQLEANTEAAMTAVREQAQQEYAAELAAEEQAKLDKRKESNMQYMKGKRTQNTDVSSQNGKPKKSPFAISKEMVKQLGIGDYIGTRKMNNLPQSVLGYYQTKTKYIAVRSKEAGDYATTMHEMGHAIAEKIGMTGTPQMVANLDPVFAASYKASELPGEAFAEFMWKYMIGEQEARDFAGDAYVDAFERALVKNKLDKIVHKNADLLRAWVNANANDKIGATIKDRSSVRTVSIRDQFRKFFAGALDATIAAERVMKKIREQTDSGVDFDSDIRSNALMKNTASKRAFYILTKNLTNAKWEVVGESLADVLENAGVEAKDMQLLERYMLALHSLDRDAKGKPVFDEHITKESRMEFIEQVRREHPEIVEAEKGFQKWRTQFLTEFLVKTGKISQDELDAFNKMYPHYVPTQRVKSNRNAAFQHKGAKKFQIRSATGSTEDIWSPIDTFATMVDSIVKVVSANNAALAWANAYEKYEGMGAFGRRITPDVKKVEVDTTGLQAQVKEKLEGSIEDDALQDILDMIGEKQSQFKVMAGKSNTPNTLAVQMPDGRIELFEMQDVELYKLLASVNDNASNLVFDVLGKLVKGMAMLTTGSNPVFAVRNFMRDFQNSVNYGSWASNYVTGFAKWMRAAWDVFREKGDFQKYQALGGGGWTRIDAGTKKGAAQYRSEMFKGYNTSNVGRTAKFLGQKLWNTITLARLNEVIEQTSRYAEFKYGKNDTSTSEGAQKAFIAAQDVTVDFSRSGNGSFGYVMKQLVPFFGASSQGVYRTARMVTEAERSRLPARFAKTVVNTGLMSVLASGLLLKFLDDDEKKEYELMSDEMKAQNFYLPNFAPEIFGEQPLIRIPLAQDPLTYAVHGAFTNAVWSGNSDGPVLELEGIANAIIDGLNPLGSGTVFQPLIGAFASNKNWYGGNIVPTNLSSLPEYAQYTEETPDVFVALGRFSNISPLKIQYLAEQYTGFLGQLAIPALSKDEFTGELGGVPAVISAVQKKFTSDPLVSNDVISSFYDGFDEIEGIKDVAEDGKPVAYLRRGLTEAEATSAYTEAKELVSADGLLGQTKKAISDMYKEIDKINANDTLSDEEKYVLTSDVRRKMIEQTLVAQETIGEYREKYITGTNLITRITPGPVVHIPDAYESLPDVFKADESKDYMQKARQVWEATENDSALPHPNDGFEYTPKGSPKQTYVVKGTEHWETWNEEYRKGYEKYIKGIKNFDKLTDEEKLEKLKKAHETAHGAAKAWYKKNVLGIH